MTQAAKQVQSLARKYIYDKGEELVDIDFDAWGDNTLSYVENLLEKAYVAGYDKGVEDERDSWSCK